MDGKTISPQAVDRTYPPAQDTHIVRAAIHPGIGIARIGNSTAQGADGYYIGPEVITPPRTKSGDNRDAQGAIKRQAARFRIYGYNAAGEVVGEIKADDALIEWTVHLANKKAQWYQFQFALDLPEASTASFVQRNAEVKERVQLAIDPGPRTIKGENCSGPKYQFNTGKFRGTTVPLGELRTDEVGRLLVLGGQGKSGSPKDTPIFKPKDPDSFNNADGWYDDISDGPVTATVSIAGREIPVEPGWVVVGPPNYAPDVISWRTLYDLLTDVYVQCGWLTYPETVSFTKDVLPSLQRFSKLQWVNKGFAAIFGKGGPLDFEDPELIRKLAYKPENKEAPDPYAELRQNIFNAFRPANNKVNEPRTWPWIYGDAFGSFKDSPDANLALPDVRAALLRRWVEGDFVNDWHPDTDPPQRLEDVPLAEQPDMLDQAALHFCLADAFHPGCEMTWPMRHPTMYSTPFRIRHRPADEPAPDYGTKLTQEIVLQPGGPLYAQGPGDISRWMALPWQGDTAFCRSGYEPEYDPYLPTFWPARVPNQVLSARDYAIVMDESRSREERIAAFNHRENWLRELLVGNVDAPEVMMRMVARFGELGIVEARPGIKNDPDFPEVMLVESLPKEREERLAAEAIEEPPRKKSRLEQAGWESHEQKESFHRVRIRHE